MGASPHSGKVNLERLVRRNELYLSRIDHGIVSFFTDKDSDDSFEVDFKYKEEQLEGVVKMIYRGQEEAYSYLGDDEQTLLKVALYDSFEKYKIANNRKLTGAPFVQHPLRVARTLIKAGVTDLTTIIAALYHDTAEEFVASHIRNSVKLKYKSEHEELDRLTEKYGFLTRSIKQLQGKRMEGYEAKVAGRREELDLVEQRIVERKRFIQEKKDEVRKEYFDREATRGGNYVVDQFVNKEIYNKLENYMSEFGVDDDTMIERIGGVAVTSYLLTRGTKENYYDSINRIFRPGLWEELACWGGEDRTKPEDIEMAIMIKFADCHANTDEIRRREPGRKKIARLMDRDSQPIEEITYDEIIAAYRKGPDLHDRSSTRTLLKDKANELSKRHPQTKVRKGTKYFPGFERLYRLYKNVILVNAYRRWKAQEGHEIPDVQNFVLVNKTLKETNQIIDHLCSYHTDDSSSLTHYKVYKIHMLYEAYKAKGGFSEVTEPSGLANEFSFDGISSEIFNPRTMKDRDSIKDIYEQKDKMLMAALAIKAQCESYLENPTYVLNGLRRSGLETSASLDEPTEP